ncbi:3-dehydroquinate synthase [Companilactobacillus ginsenosidimutans]|uniref:3-dehydroquinate synthase n=1 Tax=Companilactobacillus ginsenosidimutans TaxID=1007676 RepID=A0A0H4R1C0_9LACO|nr:3-dehydroquinate synthase [Companilactobacillus ginsenosidimutans]AKP67510.1 3-dehydroquinate synthase [Companilactobacillus ginsenosidimutans]
MITVTLPTKKYDVKIEMGLGRKIGETVKEVWSKRKVIVVTDEQVGDLYLHTTINELKKADFDVITATVPVGEKSKSLKFVGEIIETMADNGFTRGDGVIALGGGVVGDLSGTVASLYMRGIAFIQIATSLTAMVDSSVGGKTAVNLGKVKNIIGSFYQPDLVIIDPIFLNSLSERNLVEGYGEVVKCSALEGGDFFDLTGKINKVDDILSNAPDLIERSVNFKANVVMKDEKESNLRRILNFGHTLGHAIELLADGKLMHGEAVAIGMVTISQCFEKTGVTPASVTSAIQTRLESVGLPTSSNLIGTDAFFDHLKNDKKNDHGTLNLVALKNIGEPIIVPTKLTEMPEFVSGLTVK